MRIIIGGAGEVGTHLSKMLAKENLDITLMDASEERLNFSSNVEIMTVVGNPTSIEDLVNAGIKKADIFIGVTPEESTNMTACMLATNLGAARTVARVSNNEYLLPKNLEFFKKLGVDSLICPEMLAAHEIVNAIQRPWTRQWWELHEGALILIGVKVRENAPIVDKFLYDLSKDEKIYHIVAIKRENETIIPRGKDQIKSGDILFFTTTARYVNDVKEHTGKGDIKVDSVVILGGSRIALKVVEYLPENIRIKILERNKEKCYRLAEKVGSNVMIINGDGRDTDLLKEENVKDSDAFIALTENSETNILACVTAKTMGIRKTVAKVENIDYITMAEKLDIGTVVNKKLIAAGHIYQFLLDADVSNVKCLAFANAEVAELIARPRSKITKKPVKELNLPDDLTLGGLIRDGQPMIINGDTLIREGDHVVVFCLNTTLRKIEDFFN
ncbi:MAG: Trk system potassium transporter TrkA [Dysgonamonadaceae bacterium]|jgi:trk system potassium uptake protein TrkA|nr:Trk system potassium transporter TrkA [Dysgonamonadaceae bacterium]